jgi:mono/diheme cytochrome c family protein
MSKAFFLCKEIELMRALRIAAFVAPIALPAMLLSGCGAAPGSAAASPAPKGPPAFATEAHIAEGRRLYSNGVCVGCHGPVGNGTGNGPPLSDNTWLHGDGSFSQIVSIVTDGFQLSDLMDQSYRRGMPSRGEDSHGKRFSDDEVKEVASYVWSLTHDVTTGEMKKQ